MGWSSNRRHFQRRGLSGKRGKIVESQPLGLHEYAPVETVVATDSVSVNADYDNGSRQRLCRAESRRGILGVPLKGSVMVVVEDACEGV
jgi:hypothetical protein